MPEITDVIVRGNIEISRAQISAAVSLYLSIVDSAFNSFDMPDNPWFLNKIATDTYRFGFSFIAEQVPENGLDDLFLEFRTLAQDNNFQRETFNVNNIRDAP